MVSRNEPNQQREIYDYQEGEINHKIRLKSGHGGSGNRDIRNPPPNITCTLRLKILIIKQF